MDQRLSVVVECVTRCEASVVQRVVFMLGGVWTEGLTPQSSLLLTPYFLRSYLEGLVWTTPELAGRGLFGVLPARPVVYIVPVAPPAWVCSGLDSVTPGM